MSEAGVPAPPHVAVFVHGAGGGGWEWGVWGRVFAAHGHAVLAPDLQAGPRGLAGTTLDEYAAQVGDWVAAARRRHPQASLVLVGASLGGLLALMQASEADALVLVNPMPPEGLPSQERAPTVQPWGRTASLAGTRRAVPEADDLAALHAFRRWRDESGRVLDQARAGVAVAAPACPVLLMASDADAQVPMQASAALAERLGATLLRQPGSHVAPLLGRDAAGAAVQAVEWLNGIGAPA